MIRRSHRRTASSSSTAGRRSLATTRRIGNVLPVPDGATKEEAYGPNWNNHNLLYNGSSSTPAIFLDQIYDDILPDSWLVIKGLSAEPTALRVHSTATPSLSKFTLNAMLSSHAYELPSTR
ncbi:MAG: hypothetical protein R2867_26270 [Caldilineaceae bacterium]